MATTLASSDFFEPQTYFAQQMPDLRNVQLHTSLTAQPVSNFGQCQVRHGLNPDQNLLLCLCTGVRLAPRAMRHALGPPGPISLRGDLLCPTDADKETLGQLLKRVLALVVGG